jgi:hypothetical protein
MRMRGSIKAPAVPPATTTSRDIANARNDCVALPRQSDARLITIR